MTKRSGGVIVDIVELEPTRWWIDTWNHLEPTDMRTCAVYCDPGVERPDVGDSLEWDDNYCFWTPADGSRTDVPLTKLGNGGVPHPNIPPAEQGGRRRNA